MQWIERRDEAFFLGKEPLAHSFTHLFLPCLISERSYDNDIGKLEGYSAWAMTCSTGKIWGAEGRKGRGIVLVKAQTLDFEGWVWGSETGVLWLELRGHGKKQLNRILKKEPHYSPEALVHSPAPRELEMNEGDSIVPQKEQASAVRQSWVQRQLCTHDFLFLTLHAFAE